MKNKLIRPLFFLVGILLASCSGNPSASSDPASTSDSSTGTGAYSTDPYYGEDRYVTLYAINDFHGRINPNPDEYEAGIVRVGGFMKAKGQEENTMILCTGDLWQGTLESNYNRGALLTDVMNEAQFDAFTFGNHEFDWGADYIRQNRLRKDPETGYSTPFISSNIYNYDIETGETLDFADLGDPYVIHELENGLKVGIIGGIGYNQITAITSTFADEFVFINPTSRSLDKDRDVYLSFYQRLAEEVRAKGCDVVILDHHGGQEELLSNRLTAISSYTGKRFFDGVFCAHTHYRQKTTENGVPFIQGACNGTAYSTMTLKVAGDGTGAVTCESYDNPYTSTISSSYDDEAIAEIVASYAEETNAIGSEVLTTLSGSWSENEEIPNLVCESVAKYCESQNIDIDIAIVNEGRASLEAGELSYSELFSAIPFDNEIYVLETSGADILSRARGNYLYRVSEEAFTQEGTYKAAVIDYLAVHRSSARQYDYFPSANWETATTLKKDGEVIRYRDITAENLRSKDSFSNEDYLSTLTRFNRTMLSSDVTF